MKRFLYIPLLLLALVLCAGAVRAQLVNELVPLLNGAASQPVLDLDFRNMAALPPNITYTRGFLAAWDWQGGKLVPFSTNSIRNNSMQGAVAGTPGTLPTNWGGDTLRNGVQLSVVGTGTEGGIDYVDVQWVGTPTATASNILQFETNSAISSANQQLWNLSFYDVVTAGSTANTTWQTAISERDGSGNFLAQGLSSFTPGSAGGLSANRVSSGYTNVNASTAHELPKLLINYTLNQPVNVTLRIGWPMLELGMPYANPNPAAMRTTGTVVSQPMLPISDPVTGTSLGWGIWSGSGFQQAPWGRDLTQATWGKTNVTAALDQTGVDGVANAASSITATGGANCPLNLCTVVGSGNGGVLTTHALSAFVKRITGTGKVYMSGDSGSNWTDITNSINSSTYTRVPNPQGLYTTNVQGAQNIGFKLMTSGDKIAVDFVNYEQDQNSAFWAPTPAVYLANGFNFLRGTDVATLPISSVPGMNPDSFTVVLTAVVPKQWRGFGINTSGWRAGLLQIDDGTVANSLYLNYQADFTAGNPSCAQNTGNIPSCPDVNLDSKIGSVNNSKVRCSTAGSGLATLVTPIQNVFFTVAISYDRLGGIRIACDNGIGTEAVTETAGPAIGFSSGQLTQIHFGCCASFGSNLSGYLTRVAIYPRALTGASLAQAMRRQRQQMPFSTREYPKFNTNGFMKYNSGGLVQCYGC